MTILTAAIVPSPLGGIENPLLSTGMRSFAVDYWPPHAAAAGSVGGSSSLLALPVHAPSRLVVGAVAPSYMQDFYYRVHIQPALIDLGNLVSTQVREIDVWNAYPDRPLTLLGLQQVGAGGMDLSGPGAAPLNFNPLQQRTWQLAVNTDGPPTIDAILSWLFAGQAPVEVRVTGNRLTAWLFVPDWGNAGITETLIWFTDVQQAVDGSQERIVDRDTPRRQWELDALAEGNERQLMEAVLYSWRGRNWALPVFADIELLAAALPIGSVSIPLVTADLDYVNGGLALLWTDTRHFELVEVAEVQPASLHLSQPTLQSWPARTRLYPCRTSRITDTPQLTRGSSNVLQTTVRFEAVEPCDWPAVAPAATYLGIPVLEDRPDESTDPTASFDRQLDVEDNDVGLVSVDDISDLPWPKQSHSWLLYGRRARAAHRSLLYWLQGRANALWVPSWSDDITLAAPAVPTATALVVGNAGISQYLGQLSGRRHIRIELNSGAIFYRALIGAAAIDTDTEQLAIDTAIGVDLAPASVRQISWMVMATLADDSVELAHVTDSKGIATCDVSFIGVPAEEP